MECIENMMTRTLRDRARSRCRNSSPLLASRLMSRMTRSGGLRRYSLRASRALAASVISAPGSVASSRRAPSRTTA